MPKLGLGVIRIDKFGVLHFEDCNDTLLGDSAVAALTAPNTAPDAKAQIRNPPDSDNGEDNEQDDLRIKISKKSIKSFTKSKKINLQ